MKVYNPKDWVIFLLKPQNSHLFRQMNLMLLIICTYTAVVVFVEKDWLQLDKDHYLKNTITLQSLLGFAISILLVFRTNTAYDRWWEGRKLWGGVVNNSRNLAIKIHAIFPEKNEHREFFRKIIPFFAKALNQHLLAESTRLMLDEIDHPELKIDRTKHIPNQVSRALYQKVMSLNRKGILSFDEVRILDHELSALVDICGACERIKNTPIPYSYSVFSKKIVFFYILSLPIGLSFTLGYFCIPIVALVFYVMVGMELVAEEIEDPFGGDSNDIPMERITNNIFKHVNEILE